MHVKSYTEFLNERYDDYDDLDSDSDLAALKKYVYDASYGYLSQRNIENLLSEYPNEKRMVVYRGLFFKDKDKHDKFLEEIKDNKLTTKAYSSWAHDMGTAKQFAMTKPTNNILFLGREFFRAESERKEKKEYTQGYGLIIKTIIDTGVGIDVAATPVAQEAEIILPAGEYTVRVADRFMPHGETVKTIDDIDEWVQAQRGLRTKRDKGMDFSMMEYILHNYGNGLNDKSKRHLFNMFAMPRLSANLHIVEKDKYRDKKIYKYADNDWIGWQMEKDKKKHELYGGAQKTYVVTLDRNVWPMVYYMPLFTEDDQQKVISFFEDLSDEIQREAAEIKRKDKVDNMFFEMDIPIMRVLGKDRTRKLYNTLNKDVGRMYQQMNSRDQIKEINDIKDPEKKREAIAKMTQNLKDLFQKIAS